MTQDDLKRAVALAALEHVLPHLHADTILGIGTGSTANFFIDYLAAYKSQFAGAVASSNASAERLQQQGIAVLDLNRIQNIQFYVDGADEVNRNLELIKGGGAALTQEKIVAAVAATFVCIADASKLVTQLGRFPLPVEVIPMARAYVARRLSLLGGRPVYREGVVTDNGCHILDVYDLAIHSPLALEQEINQITGTVSNGLFAQRKADVLLLGTDAGVQMVKA